jgi:hypothetical protein
MENKRNKLQRPTTLRTSIHPPSTLEMFLLPIRTNKLVDFLQTCAKQHIGDERLERFVPFGLDHHLP